MSFSARGRPCPDPRLIREWQGISVRGTEANALAFSRVSPHLGSYAAEIAVDEESTITYEPTFQEGHFTLWGEPAVLLASVVRVIRLDGLGEPRVKEPTMDYSIPVSSPMPFPNSTLSGIVYEIWDEVGEGVVYATSTEAEAISLVSKWLEDIGPSYVGSLLLIRFDEEGRPALIAKGLEIVSRSHLANSN